MDGAREIARRRGRGGVRRYPEIPALLLALALAAGCAGDAAAPKEPQAASPAQPAAEQDGAARIVFFDSRVFDEDLSSAMSSGKSEIEVNVPAGFNLNKIPERVDRWLYSVKDSGGKVEAIPEEKAGQRGIVTAVIDVVVSIFDKVREMRLYGPSEQYRATLLYQGDGTVRKVLFERR